MKEELLITMENKELLKKATKVLKATSRTFFIPINGLPSPLKETIMSAYLCMRAIDEIEDDQKLAAETKITLLMEISAILKGDNIRANLINLFQPYKDRLQDVSLDLADWIDVCPPAIKNTILNYTAKMSYGMAKWVEKNWVIQNKEDLDEYTYYVAGLVGELLSDIWFWHNKTKTDKAEAVAFGRGLQAVNIVRNREEDLQRGVNFFPESWEKSDMIAYAKANLQMADRYIQDLKTGPIYTFCVIPLRLAHATLEAIEMGKEKISRTEVLSIVTKVKRESYS